MATANTPAIYAALLEVQKGLANIPKNGVMDIANQKYNYLKAHDVQEKINPLLTKHGVIVLSDYSVRYLNPGETGLKAKTVVDLTLTYTAVADGSSVSVSAAGESLGMDDKSVNKALTQALKNSHRAQFQFSSGEAEPDDFPSEPEARAKAPSATPKASPRASAQAKAPSATPSVDKVNSLVKSGKADKDEVAALRDAVMAEKNIEGPPTGAQKEEVFSEILKRLG